MEINLLTPEDDKEAVEFCRTIYLEMGFPLHTLPPTIAQLFNETGDVFATAKQDGEIIGTAGFLRLSHEDALIKRFYLSKQVRGSGLASEMFTFLVKKARSMGYSTLLLDVQKTNKRAIRFYEKEGMKEFSIVSPRPRWEGSSLERQKTDRYFHLVL